MEGLILNTLGFGLVYSSGIQLLGIYADEGRPFLTKSNYQTASST